MTWEKGRMPISKGRLGFSCITSAKRLGQSWAIHRRGAGTKSEARKNPEKKIFFYKF